MISRDRAVILLLSGTLAVMNGACSRFDSFGRSNEPPHPVAVDAIPSPTPQPQTRSEATPTPPANPQPKLAAEEVYQRALDAAKSAAIIGQSAQSPDDWQLAIARWQEAINLLELVPSTSVYYGIAQPKIAEYQRNLNIAQQQATRPRPASPPSTAVATRTVIQPPSSSPTDTETASEADPAQPTVFQAPIKRRAGRTPVIEVTFNDGQTFEMILDTGASGTVITQEMAQSLGVVPDGEVIADTASAKGVKFPVGTVESIAVDGARQKNFRVAIATPDLELGLLGQDFYSHYDIVIRQDRVEFHSR